jgi:oxazoline/thiazoline synthase
MLTYPKLKSCYQLSIADPETALLLHETDSRILRGRLYALILPLLDGRRTVEEITERLSGEASAAEVLYGLFALEKRGHLVENDPMTPPEVAAYWHSLGVDTQILTRALAERPIALHAIGDATALPLQGPLTQLGVQRAETGALSVIVTDDYLADDLDAQNQRALSTQRPWMLIKLVGVSAWIGPIFHPGKTGCWACLSQRLRGQRPLETTLARSRGESTRGVFTRAALPASVDAAANLAAIEIAQWIAGASLRLEGHLITLDTRSIELADHTLVKRPQCPACGDLRRRAEAAPLALVLEPRPKGFTADGGHRALRPEETFATYAHHISPITGAVRTLERLSTGEDRVICTYGAGPNLALTSDDLSVLRTSFRSHSGGKGKSDAQARASALCEAIERYSGVFQGDEPRRRARAEDLGGAAILPGACMLFSEAQYAHRRAWNAPGRDLPQRVPEPFDASEEIEWSPVWSLTRGELRYLPTAYCYYGYPIPPERRFCFADSNGSAAGACREEAILQGFMELVERDGVSLWWYNRLKRPRVDLSSFEEPYFEELTAAYQRLGRELWMLDLTSDLGVPTFAALSRRTDSPREEITLGFGAHFEAKIAALRALTEGNQFLPVLQRASGPVSHGDDSDPMSAWMGTATVSNQPYLDFDRAAPPKVAADYPDVANLDLAEDVRRCVAEAARRGLETLVLDQTRPDIGLPVVKVFVPGLRHFWRRLGPGRLYDVPVKMGWLRAKLTEDELNPLHVFF